MPQRYDLVLVTLTKEQIAKAKEANGPRKRITHALLCGPYGQMFGTENQCWKYYAAWSEIFSELFARHTRRKGSTMTNSRMTSNQLTAWSWP